MSLHSKRKISSPMKEGGSISTRGSYSYLRKGALLCRFLHIWYILEYYSSSPYFILMVKVSEKWVKHQNIDDMELFYQWDEKYLAIGELSTSFLENSWDISNPEFLKTNPIKNLHMLWKYLHHLVRESQ